MPTPISPRVAALIERTRVTRARLSFAIDATQSREQTWDLAMSMQTAMFEEAAKIGGLEVELTRYGGNKCESSPWTTDPSELARQMRMTRCEAGATQIVRVLQHIRKENAH